MINRNRAAVPSLGQHGLERRMVIRVPRLKEAVGNHAFGAKTRQDELEAEVQAGAELENARSGNEEAGLCQILDIRARDLHRMRNIRLDCPGGWLRDSGGGFME